jgi:ATP-dependent RNA helicase DeaD
MGKQITELSEGAQIVSGTPGRVLDHLRRGTLDPSGIRALVLDEMDEMLSMGFARELNAILELIPDRSRRQTMCFSATVDDDIRRHAERYMNDPLLVSLSRAIWCACSRSKIPRARSSSATCAPRPSTWRARLPERGSKPTG